MNRFLKNAILSAAVAATTLATLPAAQAGDRWQRRHEVARQNDDADVVLAGILGIALGAVVVGMLATPEPKGPVDRNPYRNPRPSPDREFFPPAPEPADIAYEDETIEPWTAAWYDYCQDTYRTFDTRTGTYKGKDGRKHFCVAG